MGKGISAEEKDNNKVGESFDPYSLSEISNLNKQQVADLGIDKDIKASSNFIDLCKQIDKEELLDDREKLHTIEEEEDTHIGYNSNNSIQIQHRES